MILITLKIATQMISANRLEGDILQYTIDGEVNDNDIDVFSTILRAMSSKQKCILLIGEIKNMTNVDAIKNYLISNGVSKVMTKKLKKYVLICDAEVQEFFRSMNTLYFKNIQIEFFRSDQRELALAAVRT